MNIRVVRGYDVNNVHIRGLHPNLSLHCEIGAHIKIWLLIEMHFQFVIVLGPRFILGNVKYCIGGDH
jgi:hypothetical protein